MFPDHAEELFKRAEYQAKERYQIYKQMASSEPIDIWKAD